MWGEDAGDFKPGSRSVAEYETKSLSFAEASKEHACPARNLAIGMATAFLQEWCTLGIDWAPPPSKVGSGDLPPFYNTFTLIKREEVVVVGAGAAGLTCALTLARQGFRVRVLECEAHIGGHAAHVEVFGGHRRNPAFGVFQEAQWPNACRLFKELGVEAVQTRANIRDFAQRYARDGHAVPQAPRVSGCDSSRAWTPCFTVTCRRMP